MTETTSERTEKSTTEGKEPVVNISDLIAEYSQSGEMSTLVETIIENKDEPKPKRSTVAALYDLTADNDPFSGVWGQVVSAWTHKELSIKQYVALSNEVARNAKAS